MTRRSHHSQTHETWLFAIGSKSRLEPERMVGEIFVNFLLKGSRGLDM